MLFQERVRDIYLTLSPSYRRLAEFLVESYRDAAFMTAAELGRAVRVDTTSVVRFAQRLGYAGYPELIDEIQDQVKQDLRAIYEPVPEERTPEAVFRRNLLRDRENLDYLLQQVDLASVPRILQILKSAHRIYVVGESSGAPLAEYAQVCLSSLGFSAVRLPGDTGGRVALTIPLQHEDVLVALSPTGAGTGVAVVTKVAREEGAQTVAIVGSPSVPAAAVAEHVLYAPAQSVGIFPSLTATLSVLNALIQALALTMVDSAAWALRAQYLYERYHEVWREPIAGVPELLREYNAASPAAAAGVVVPEDSNTGADLGAGADVSH